MLIEASADSLAVIFQDMRLCAILALTLIFRGAFTPGRQLT